MKNKKRIWQIIAVISIILSLVTIIFPVSDEYFNHQIHNKWLRESCPDGIYTIVADEVGHPFMFGSSKANITLFKSNDRCISNFNVSIRNNGNSLSNNNCSVDWQDEYVKITIYDYHGEIKEIYRFHYSDYLM